MEDKQVNKKVNKGIIILAIIVVAILVAVFYGYKMYNKPHRNIAKEIVLYTFTSNQLFDEFDIDEEAANRRYLDKTIQVSGKIINIDKDQEQNTVLTLEAENAMIGGVLCTIKDKSLQFKEETDVSLKCRCTGFLSDVIMVDCSVVE